MGEKLVLEGYVYRYCHADDCHTVLMPRRLGEEDVRKVAEEKLSHYSEKSRRKEIEEWILPAFRKNMILDWQVFWDGFEKEATIPCEVLEEYVGKKVRVTIEVIG